MSIDKRIVHELSADDLIAMAQGAKVEDVVEKLTDAAKFIYSVGIKNGKTKVHAQLVYFTYKQWKIRGKHQPKVPFFKDFRQYFEAHRDKDGMYYLLNEKPFDLSQENFWAMRKQLRDVKNKKTKK